MCTIAVNNLDGRLATLAVSHTNLKQDIKAVKYAVILGSHHTVTAFSTVWKLLTVSNTHNIRPIFPTHHLQTDANFDEQHRPGE